MASFSLVFANAKSELYRYEWPGNVRELRNVIERSLHRQGEDESKLLSWSSTPGPWTDGKSESPPPETRDKGLNSELPRNLRAALDNRKRHGWSRR